MKKQTKQNLFVAGTIVGVICILGIIMMSLVNFAIQHSPMSDTNIQLDSLAFSNRVLNIKLESAEARLKLAEKRADLNDSSLTLFLKKAKVLSNIIDSLQTVCDKKQGEINKLMAEKKAMGDLKVILEEMLKKYRRNKTINKKDE